MNAIRLKEVLSRHRLAMTAGEVSRSNILARATPYLGAGIHAEDVVVIHADPWLVEGNAIANDALSPVEEEKGAEDENAEAGSKTHDNDL
jgi:hypothetical protein